MSVISTGLTPAFLLPGATKAFGDAYADKPTYVDKMFEVRASDRSYEEHTLMAGMGMAQAKPEGSSIAYDSMRQMYTQRFLHVTYALGYIITEEAMEDLKSVEISVMRARQLKRALMTKQETVGANVFNNGFSGGPTLADGKTLLASDHPTLDGTQSNILAVAADLSEASLEQLLINIKKAKDVSGIRIDLRATDLIIPVDEEPNASRILESVLRSSTSDNDKNWVKGRIDRVIANPYLSDTDAWFLKTDCPDGLIMYNRRPMRLEQDGDFDTSNSRFKASNRYSVGAVDFRGVYGSPGA